MVRFVRLPAALALLCLPGAPVLLGAQGVTPLRDATVTELHLVQGDPGLVDAPEFRERRPAALLPLYASFVTLQMLDAHSTWRAFDRGGVEANPLIRGIAANEVGLIAIKAVGTAGVIAASERIWTKNRAAALLFMIATNSAVTWVVQHNYRAGRR
jgi:hypothetical protein